MTLSQIQAAARLWIAGKKISEIAEAVRVPERTINRHVNAIKFEVGLQLARAA